MWVECVTKAIPNQVDTKHRQENEQSRNKDQPGCLVEVSLPTCYHIAPTGIWGSDTEVKEAQNRLKNDVIPYEQSGVHNDWSCRVWQNVPEHQTQVFCSNRACGQDILAFPVR